jgi:hypothetical protein
LPNSRRDLFPHRNLVRRCHTNRISPNTAIILNLHRFQRDLQLVAFREVVPSYNAGHTHLPTGLLQVQVRPVVLTRVGDLNCQSEQNLNIDGPPRDLMLQCHAVQKLHGDERLAVLVVNFVDGADVGMIQRGSCLGFG